ncbi:MAG: TlpA family protein disulfide reductase [Cyclobacteriaceae bacterium]|nr:TlpA family protein disulfide reductase [Cyclobacteriaceae bacterium]
MNARLIVVALLLASCVVKDDPSYSGKLKSRHIVLIFENFPIDHKVFLNDTQKSAYTIARYELKYYDDNGIQRTLKPKSEPNDTIIITSDRETIEVQHRVKTIDNYEYVFQRGDTVLFKYSDKVPQARVINREVSEYEVNYDLKYREKVCQNGYPALCKLLNPLLFVTFNADYFGLEGERPGIAGQTDKIKAMASIRFTGEQEKEHEFIDSLFSAGLISNKSFDWLKQRLQLNAFIKDAHLNATDLKQVSEYLNGSDSLLGRHSYRLWLSQLRATLYDNKVNRISTKNSNFPDYRIVYDSIVANKNFSGKLRDVFLFETLDLLFERGKLKENKLYAQRMKDEIRDSTLINHLLIKYQLEAPSTNEIQLISLTSERTSLNQVLQMNFGKIIYVDIWASWCGPCIQEFPASKDLRSKLKGQNVVFVYLSIDDDKVKWQTSSVKNSLPDNNSYVVVDKVTSTQWNELDVQSIPRYLIYNRNGDLKFRDAPRPSSPETFELIQKLLSQK